MDDRLRIDLQALEAAEVASINQLTSASTQAAEQIQTGAQQASGELDAVAAALICEIDRAVEEAEVVVSAEEEPYLPGIADVIEAAHAAVTDTGLAGRTQLGNSAIEASAMLGEVATSFAGSRPSDSHRSAEC